jgi:hypothetical protein
MNLNQMIRRTARLAQIEDDLFVDGNSKTGAYLTDAEAVKLKNSIIDSLNGIIKTAARERGILTYSEEVTGSTIDVSELENTFLRVKSVKDEYENDIIYKKGTTGIINLEYVEDTDKSIFEYYLLPAELEKDSEDCPIPENLADNVMFCNYAAFEILAAKEDTKSAKRAQIQLDLFNDKYRNVTGDTTGDNIAEGGY